MSRLTSILFQDKVTQQSNAYLINFYNLQFRLVFVIIYSYCIMKSIILEN